MNLISPDLGLAFWAGLSLLIFGFGSFLMLATQRVLKMRAKANRAQ